MLIAISFVCLCMVVGVRGVGGGVVTLSGSSFQSLLILEVGKCVWVWVCASVRRSWHINVADETSTSGRVTKSAGSLYQRALGGLLCFISQCVSIRAPQLSEPSEPGAPAPSAPSASHRRGRSGAKKHREMGADVSAEEFQSFCLWVKTNIYFFFLDQPRVVFAQRYHISRAGCAPTNKDEEQDSFGFARGCSLDLALYSRRLNG